MNLSIQVIRNGELSSARQDELNHLLKVVFSGQDEGLLWSLCDWNVLVYLDEVLVSNVEILTRVVTVDGEAQRVGGIGGVATLPEYRRHGFASQAMQRAEDFMRNTLGLEFALLVCSHERVPLYESLGWQVVAGPLVFDQPDGKRTFDEVVMVLSLTGKPWNEGKIDIMGLPW